MRFSAFAWSLCALGAAGVVSSAARGATIDPGVYTLHNHPDGSERPPLYGARFDELVNATGGHDVFTLDFDHPLSSVTLTYTGTTIHIQGVALGGRDVGGSYASDAFLGLYTIDFLYTLGVMPVMGDDDVWVNTANHVNSGSIVLPDASVVSLVDERGGNGFSLRLGDEDNDAGHRGAAGISGWGWMSYAGASVVHVESTDWLFTMTRNIPTPGSAALGLMGLAVFTRRKR